MLLNLCQYLTHVWCTNALNPIGNSAIIVENNGFFRINYINITIKNQENLLTQNYVL